MVRDFCYILSVDVGSSQTEDCPLSALLINQAETGRVIESRKEWNVNIRHVCVTCEISEVNVTCHNLKPSFVKVNANVISKTPSGKCQLNGGKSLDTDTKLHFTYVSSHRIDFQPLEFLTSCF